MTAIFAVINRCLSSVHCCEDHSHIHFLILRLTLKYSRNKKNPADTPSIPKQSLNINPDINWTPPSVQVNLSTESSTGCWNLPHHLRSKQGNDYPVHINGFGALFAEAVKNVEPAQPYFGDRVVTKRKPPTELNNKAGSFLDWNLRTICEQIPRLVFRSQSS